MTVADRQPPRVLSHARGEILAALKAWPGGLCLVDLAIATRMPVGLMKAVVAALVREKAAGCVGRGGLVAVKIDDIPKSL